LSLVARFLSVFRGIAIVIAIGVVFMFGVAATGYISLRSPEVTVPDVTGKNRFDAEKVLADADLKFRVRAYRPSNEAKPDTVMFQLPRAGEVVKAGQTVAMDISRATKAGEASETVIPDEDTNTNANRNANSNTNANENKPRRPRNRNANDANANTNGNANRAANANRTNANTTGNVNVPRANVNRTSTGNVNARPAGNVNDNRRPVTPRPTPVPNPTRTRPAP
jgi:beta-lactam-binding protein with PASTA domain